MIYLLQLSCVCVFHLRSGWQMKSSMDWKRPLSFYDINTLYIVLYILRIVGFYML